MGDPTGCRPEALMLTPVVPTAGGNGLSMRAGVMLDGLSRSFRVRCLIVPVFGGAGPSDGLVERLGVAVDVLPLDPAPDPVADLKVRLADPAARARAEAVHPRPALCRTATVAAADAVASAAVGVALVHVFRLYLAPFLDALLDRPDRPLLTLDVDDDETVTRRRLGEPDAAVAYHRLAAHYLPAVDHVVAPSAVDAHRLRTAHRLGQVRVVPNAVRLPEWPPATAAAGSDGTYDLLFVGNLSYGPNIDGARWLCREVLPLLPGASVALVGSDPAPEVSALAGGDDRVTVVGPVADLAPWYDRARVAVVPVRAGGGTRIKLLEALAHGRPVVATTLGAEGLDLVPGRDGVLVADDPAAFADACRRLLDDPDLAGRLAAAGRQVVADTASVDVVAAAIDRLFQSLVIPTGGDSGPDPGRVAELSRQLRLNRLAAETSGHLADAGVRAVLLKGASFGAWLYDSTLDRPCGDVDLLIDPAAEDRAGAVLSGLGFNPLYGRSRAMLLGRPAVVWTRGQEQVDLHRGLFWGVTVPAERAWAVLRDHTEHLTVGGTEVEVLDTTARTVHVAVHAAASGPGAVRPGEDLRRAVARVPRATWEEAARLASDLGAVAAFHAGLNLTPEGPALARVLAAPTPPPGGVARSLAAPTPPPGSGTPPSGRHPTRSLARQGRLATWTGQRPPAAGRRVASLDAALHAGGSSVLAGGVARLLALPGIRPKLQAAARIVVPTPSYLATRLPWARRSPLHQALAYPAWLAFLARRTGEVLLTVAHASRGNRVSRQSPPQQQPPHQQPPQPPPPAGPGTQPTPP